MHRHFCTYFDHRYLRLGLALHASLRRICPDFTLWVLALDDEAAWALRAMALPSMKIICLAELERFDQELKAIEGSRSRIEYYFTCSPCLPRYLISEHGLGQVTYLDSDLWFFSDPEILFHEIGGESVAIVPHRLARSAAHSHAKYGRYNVGWLTFTADAEGLACLAWWRSKCIDWCFDRVEPGRYADQKYLDEFEGRFKGVHSIGHPGANLAPWNVSGHELTLESDRVLVDGHPLVFFHFQGLRTTATGVYDTNLSAYGARLSPVLRESVFKPYLRALAEADALIRTHAPSLSASPASLRRTGLSQWRLRASRMWRTLRARMTGTRIVLEGR